MKSETQKNSILDVCATIRARPNEFDLNDNDLLFIFGLLSKAHKPIVVDILSCCEKSDRSATYEAKLSLLMALYSNNMQRAITCMYLWDSVYNREEQDTFRMAFRLNRPFDPFWSSKRMEQEHSRLSRLDRVRLLRADNIDFDLSHWNKVLKPSVRARLIKNSTRLAMEGERQSHCVASYSNQIRRQSGFHTAIASVIECGQRWTVELRSIDHKIEVHQIKAAHNKTPSKMVRENIGIRFGVAAGEVYCCASEGEFRFLQDINQVAANINSIESVSRGIYGITTQSQYRDIELQNRLNQEALNLAARRNQMAIAEQRAGMQLLHSGIVGGARTISQEFRAMFTDLVTDRDRPITEDEIIGFINEATEAGYRYIREDSRPHFHMRLGSEPDFNRIYDGEEVPVRDPIPIITITREMYNFLEDNRAYLIRHYEQVRDSSRRLTNAAIRLNSNLI